MKSILHSLYSPFLLLLLALFIIIYPMFISVYVFLPLFIGVMGYYFLRGIDEGNVFYLFVTIFYFINLEVNLSLPLFLTLIAFLLVYIFFYQNLTYFRHCQVCKPLISVVLLDITYLGMLLAYDFVFQTSSVVLDNLLLYSLVVDMLVVIL